MTADQPVGWGVADTGEVYCRRCYPTLDDLRGDLPGGRILVVEPIEAGTPLAGFDCDRCGERIESE